MTEESTNPLHEDVSAHWGLSEVVGRIVRDLQEGLPPGDVADLRRLDPSDPGAPGFWKIVVRHLEPAGALPGSPALRDQAERRWASVISAMAMAPELHRPRRRLGEALAAAALSELRLVRLLRARGDALLDGVRQVARFLASKAEPVDFADLARLVTSETQTHAEAVRRDVARDYYRNIEQ